ncbi:unnamed protein product [Peronospora belbahrii]|uniref:Uncharacterized protein n=1 Tax=Peronospora belbahrii TaxID=622444 RepID=A0ABN8CUL5_9STRA|nr:unnamed protein product [Peronospora belbahrii]
MKSELKGCLNGRFRVHVAYDCTKRDITYGCFSAYEYQLYCYLCRSRPGARYFNWLQDKIDTAGKNQC